MGQIKDKTHTLTIQCDDRPGLVADVAMLLARTDCNILDAQQFNDIPTKRFFMRVEFEYPGLLPLDTLEAAFTAMVRADRMEWTIRRNDDPHKVLLMVSKFDHCLADLLYRYRIGEIDMNVVGIISNHPPSTLNPAIIGDLPFYHLPITKETKPGQEAEVMKIIDKSGAELVVLARYMQILSDDFAKSLSGKCINIHHSFLPGFKGAKPYHQAYERGVKMIGATAHYVTAALDEGPIIHQDVEAITHADTPDDLVRKGRDIERRVLANAVRFHLAGRVFINGKRTVVFKG